MENVFRLIPDFRGKRRLARFLFKDKITNNRDLVVKGKFNCIYNLPNLKDSLALDIFVNGIYEEDTHDFLVKHVPSSGLFLDLGINIGSISIPLAKRRTDIQCIGVEASPKIFGFAKKNVEENGLGDRIKCVNKALSDKVGVQLPFYSPEDQFGKGSLSPVFTNAPIMVETITIDQLVADFGGAIDVNFIKIDIEGFEYFAFKGGEKLLTSPKAPDIIFEFVDWAEDKAGLKKGSAQELLREYGYQLYVLEKKELSPLIGTVINGGKSLFASKR